MQPWHKRLEGTGKRALAKVAALVFRRAAPALPAGLRRVLLVRIDDRVGEALANMALGRGTNLDLSLFAQARVASGSIPTERHQSR